MDLNSTEVGEGCQIKYKWNIQLAPGKTMNALKDWVKIARVKITHTVETFPYLLLYFQEVWRVAYVWVSLCVSVLFTLLCSSSAAFFFFSWSPLQSTVIYSHWQSTHDLLGNLFTYWYCTLWNAQNYVSVCSVGLLHIFVGTDAAVPCRSPEQIPNLFLTLCKYM